MAVEPNFGNEILNWAVGLPAIGVVIAYGISMIRRRVSADARAIGEDKSHIELIESFRQERDEIKKDRDKLYDKLSLTEEERSKAIAEVGKLTAQVQFLSLQVIDLKALVEKLATNLDAAKSDMQVLTVNNATLSSHVNHLEEINEELRSKILPHLTDDTQTIPHGGDDSGK